MKVSYLTLNLFFLKLKRVPLFSNMTSLYVSFYILTCTWSLPYDACVVETTETELKWRSKCNVSGTVITTLDLMKFSFQQEKSVLNNN